MEFENIDDIYWRVRRWLEQDDVESPPLKEFKRYEMVAPTSLHLEIDIEHGGEVRWRHEATPPLPIAYILTAICQEARMSNPDREFVFSSPTDPAWAYVIRDQGRTINRISMRVL